MSDSEEENISDEELLRAVKDLERTDQIGGAALTERVILTLILHPSEKGTPRVMVLNALRIIYEWIILKRPSL